MQSSSEIEKPYALTRNGALYKVTKETAKTATAHEYWGRDYGRGLQTAWASYANRLSSPRWAIRFSDEATAIAAWRVFYDLREDYDAKRRALQEAHLAAVEAAMTRLTAEAGHAL